MKSSFKKKRGVSPAYAAVILLALAITTAVAGTYWMTDLSNQYTHFEEIKITNIYYVSSSGDPNNTIVVTIKNTGTILFNITEILINDQIKSFNVTDGTIELESGEEYMLTIMDVGWESGKEYSLEIQTTKENFYIKITETP